MAPKNWTFNVLQLTPRATIRSIKTANLPPKPTLFLEDLTAEASLNLATQCTCIAKQTGVGSVDTTVEYTYNATSDPWDTTVMLAGVPAAVRAAILLRKDIPSFERYALDNVVDEALHYLAKTVTINASKIVVDGVSKVTITSRWPLD